MEDRNEERIVQSLPIRDSLRNDILLERSFRSTTKVTDHSWSVINTPLDNTVPTITEYSKQMSKYDWRIHSLLLCRHIMTRGLEEGIGSDLTIRAFGRSYRLHRLILDQNPYFKLLLAGGFRESEANEVTLYLEEHPFINTQSFQFVLEYLYGKIEEPQISKDNVRQILATCSYFQLMEVCHLCVEYILKILNQQNVIDYLLFADEHMVKGADRIFDAAFTFLCREAYNMDRHILAILPLNWLEKVVESDAFWVPSEYERYQFIQQIIQAQYELSQKNPDTVIDDPSHILCKSIHYMHMTFEQLQAIRHDIHPFTKNPLVHEHILKEALWLQVQLRSKIEAANDKDVGINITTRSPIMDQEEQTMNNYPIPVDDTTTYTGEPSAIATAQKSTSLKQEYSMYPPFRFSVEFADVTSLKHGMRVYSDSIFYAGSNWNMYIQKTRSQRKGVLQLGVYLHRQSIPSQEEPQGPYSFSRYSDKRKVVKTWFKIYCPSRGPKHALTLFQSSPDNFSVLQSWGWRSTTLCAEEDSSNISEIDLNDTSKTFVPPPPQSPSTQQNSIFEIKAAKSINTSHIQKTSNQGQNGSTLRFTVVMGHV